MEKLVNFKFDSDLIDSLDSERKILNLTRSAFVRTAVTRYIDSLRFLRSQPDLQKKITDLQTALDELSAGKD